MRLTTQLRRRRVLRALILSCSLLIIAVAPALGIQRNYIGPDAGLWVIPSYWQTTGFPPLPGMPSSGDDADLGDNTNSPIQNVTLDVSYAFPGLNSLTINAQRVATFALNQGAGTDMYATSEYLGTTTYGAIYNQTGGTNTVSGLYMGSGTGTGPQGNYILSGTGLLNVNTEVVGVNPAAFLGGNQFNQSGGTHNVANLTIGGGTRGVGTYTFSGGANTVSSSLIVGDQPSSFGSYTINNAAAALTVNGAEYVGNIATGTSSGGTITQYGGTFNQSAGTHSVIGGLLVGFSSGSTGSFALSGGSLVVGTTSGQLSPNSEYIGYSGTGSFTQSGGTHTIGTPAANQSLYVGYNSAAIGSYTLNSNTAAATLTVNGNEVVGSSAAASAAANVAAVPEPGGLVFLIGVVGLARLRRR